MFGFDFIDIEDTDSPRMEQILSLGAIKNYNYL